MELAEYLGDDVAELFDVGADFLLQKRKKFQEVIISYAVIQLNKIGWEFNKIFCEPELRYLKKALEGKIVMGGCKPLYLISRRVNPILLEPMKKDRYILLV